MANNEQKFNFFSVMLTPRSFIRSAFAHRRGFYWLLALIVGFIYGLDKASLIGAGYENESLFVLVSVVILSIPIGWFIFYIASTILYWIGKLFKGKAGFEDVMRAFVWSRVPEVFQLVAWGFAIFYWDWVVFTDLFMPYEGAPIFLTLFFSVQFIFAIWKLIILFQALGTVQTYSPWFAVWNVLLTWAVLMVMDYYIAWLLGAGYHWIFISMRGLLNI